MRTTLVLVMLAAPASAQVFVIDGSVPIAGAFNSYQSDFGDVDGDGDPDLAIGVHGGASRLWINQGGAQGGAAGAFADASAARFPALLTDARDIDFADLDGDGDLDVYVAVGGTSGGASRWWINVGGAQGGTSGYYVDETGSRWLDLNSGSTSIAPSLLAAGGGFLDWSWDAEFGDLDGDGWLDLVHTSVGAGDNGLVPTRMFLNDGTGKFREFNPSGYRLAGSDLPAGAPGLWCQGIQTPNTLNATGAQCDIASQSFESELADFDGDFDLDFLLGGQPEKPRLFRNRLETGALGFRDETGAVFPSGYAQFGGYGQGLADLDNDGDLDVYGLNWAPGASDHVLVNNGSGAFTIGSLMPASAADQEDADFLDYDNDGDLDVLLAGYVLGQDLYRNELGTGGGFTKVSNLAQSNPLISWDSDVADVDLDGDADFCVSNTGNPGVYLYRNTSGVADTFAPTIPLLEQVPNRSASTTPTVVRAHVLDNISDYVVAGYVVRLEYRVDGSAFASAPMRWSGAQVFRGEIPGQVSGVVDYRVRAVDHGGNTGVSASRSFTASGWATYCTPGTSAQGCVGLLSASGVPSASTGGGFTLFANGLDAQKTGLFFYSVTGRISQSWGGTAGFLCVKAPVQRTGALLSSGSPGACDGALDLDWNLYVATHPTAHGQPFPAGTRVNAQAWVRDPASAKTTVMTQALEFVVAP